MGNNNSVKRHDGNSNKREADEGSLRKLCKESLRAGKGLMRVS